MRTHAADRALERLAGPRVRVLSFAEADTGVAGIEHVPEYAACLDGVRAAGGDDGQILRRLRELGITYVMWDSRRRGEAQELRIADPAFERRYLRLVHRDERTLVFAVRGAPGGSTRGPGQD